MKSEGSEVVEGLACRWLCFLYIHTTHLHPCYLAHSNCQWLYHHGHSEPSCQDYYSLSSDGSPLLFLKHPYPSLPFLLCPPFQRHLQYPNTRRLTDAACYFHLCTWQAAGLCVMDSTSAPPVALSSAPKSA